VAILEKESITGNLDCDKNQSRDNIVRTNGTVQADPTGPKRTAARLLFNEKVTARNTGHGGIHPIEALESHETNLAKLISKAIISLPDVTLGSSATSRILRYNNGKLKQLPDFVTVTRGPGMRSNLTCGLNTAKGLATAWQVPLLAVHHMQAHALTPRLVSALEKPIVTTVQNEKQQPRPEFPFLTLLISGGHTMLLHSKGLVDHTILATTRDVAIGDALDKCGRMILPEDIKSKSKDTAFARDMSSYAFPNPDTYESWPIPVKRRDEIDKPSNDYNWQLQTPLAKTKDLAFSFSAIASSIERIFKERCEGSGGRVSEEERLLFARTALGVAFEQLASRTVIALEMLQRCNEDISTLVASGGVAANPFLRYFLRKTLDVRGFEHVQLFFPPPPLCTDNAAMIAWCGMEMFEAGFRSELDVKAVRKWSMDPAAHDGGIIGVGGWTQGERASTG